MREVAHLSAVLAPEGWCFASSAPIHSGDPGRFNALFGRDSLITALQLLEVRPEVARCTLRALAALQGRVDDPFTDEEPGKIVHEYWPHGAERFAGGGWPVRDGRLRYYGSADSTCWFLVVLAALGDHGLSRELERVWRAAGGWLRRALDLGGGFVRYGPRDGGGLMQQGWRDSSDPVQPETKGSGILREDGSLPLAPLADADTQAVALVALRALALLSGDAGYRREAEDLRARIDAGFGPETMAIEADGREVRGAGSQQGWLLWAGALGPKAGAAAAERLCRKDVLSSFGLRTLAEGHPQHDPDAYHRGAVWPFDSWLGWGGLRAAGREADAERVRRGVLDALARLGDPVECYAVGPDGPRGISSANRVQAWTVGAAFALEQHRDGRAQSLFA
jgi:glycogen debranching enzyme